MDSSNSPARQLHSVPYLKGADNYAVWSNKMKMILIREDLWDVVNPDGEPLDDKSGKLNNKALATLVLSMSDQTASQVRDQTTARGAWKTLSALYSISGFSARHLLHTSLTNTNLASCSSIQDFVDTISSLSQQLKDMGKPVEDWQRVSVLLHGLGDSYDQFVSIVLNGARTKDPEWDSVVAQLLDEERRRKGDEATAAPLAHRAKGKGKGKGCTHCGRANHDASKCWKLHPELAPKNTGKKKEKTLDDSDKEEEKAEALMAMNSHCHRPSAWILDSGATQHMCCNRRAFKSLVQGQSTVFLGDGQSLQALGRGTVKLSLDASDGTVNPVEVQNVLYVPSLSTNLLSIRQMAKRRYQVIFKDTIALIQRSDHSILAVGRLQSGLFKLEIKDLVTQAVAVPMTPLARTDNATRMAIVQERKPYINQPWRQNQDSNVTGPPVELYHDHQANGQSLQSTKDGSSMALIAHDAYKQWEHDSPTCACQHAVGVERPGQGTTALNSTRNSATSTITDADDLCKRYTPMRSKAGNNGIRTLPNGCMAAVIAPLTSRRGVENTATRTWTVTGWTLDMCCNVATYIAIQILRLEPARDVELEHVAYIAHYAIRQLEQVGVTKTT